MAKEKGKPLTRKDVEKKIEEHGGPQGLDLSGKMFVATIDLSNLDLHGIIFKDARFPTQFEGNLLVGAKFNGSDLTGADLRSINFQYAQFKKLNNQPTCLAIADLRGSSLLNANFQSADLTGAKFGYVAEAEAYPAAMFDNTDFRSANLFRANFKGCYFYGTKLEGAYIRGADILEAHLEEADWGNYKIGEENKKDFYSAENRYRQLKVWYTQVGYSDTAAKFYYREREASRKGARHWNDRVAGWLSWAVFGHGERWKRIFIWMVGFILLFTLTYYAIGSVWNWSAFGNSLYFSAVSFTALGYGNWVQVTNNWIKGIGAFESLVGVSTMALLLVTFVRKWTR